MFLPDSSACKDYHLEFVVLVRLPNQSVAPELSHN